MKELQLSNQIGMNSTKSILNLGKLALIYCEGYDFEHLQVALKRYEFTSKIADGIIYIEDISSSLTVDFTIVDGLFINPDTVSVIRQLLLVKGRPSLLIRSSSNDEIDRIVALDMGADDCVDQSCSAREIGARAAAISRRASVTSEIKRESGGLKFAGWELQANTRHLLTPNKNIIYLTGNEYHIFSCLISSPGSVKIRADLRCYPDALEHNDGDPRTTDVMVSRLRKKMMSYGDGNIIEAARGFGYRLVTR
jgi:DNA-binding response OmpR family regulator